MTANQEHLFKEHNKARYGENKHHQNLFLPKYLDKSSLDQRLSNEKQERAYQIAQKWAKLEESGKLSKKKETTFISGFEVLL